MATMRYSVFSILANGLSGNRGWKPVWREPEPKREYDAVIIGAGHGLATAYYLAKEHGLRNIAVLEKGYLGSGNIGRNTTIVRSNYLLPGNIPFYEWSMKLWEGLERELNYNAMVSQRGVLNLFHSDPQRDAYARRGNAMRLNGIDAELLDTAGVRRLAPMVDFDNARFPVKGGLLQKRGGTVRHDAVVWGYGARRRRARRRHHPELRGDRHQGRGRPRRRRRDVARVYRREEGGAGGGRQFVAGRGDGRLAPADRDARHPGLRLRGDQAATSTSSSRSAPGTSTSASRTRADWSSAAISTATIPTPSAATCRWSRTSARAAWH